MARARRWPVRRGDGAALGGAVAAAILMICSGLIHIHLWDIAYRHVKTLGPLFLVQAVAALGAGRRARRDESGRGGARCVALMVGTIVGFILADTVGIFGFKLPVVTGWAYEALVAELLGSLVLLFLVVRSWRGDQDRRSRGEGDGRRDVGVRRGTYEGDRRPEGDQSVARTWREDGDRISRRRCPPSAALRCLPPIDPRNGASPKEKMPPSDALQPVPVAVVGLRHADDGRVQRHSDH